MAIGIVCEYNPIHNGHLYQLERIREIYKDETIIVVLSGNFTQRGDVSIIDKWTKVKLCKLFNIDLIVELPFFYATQSADFFSDGALKILNNLKVDKIVFGSETDDIETLKTIVECQVKNEDFDKLVKVYSKFGENYPTAISKAVYDLTGKKVDTPNDLLGISYIKSIIRNNYNITPVAIKRTSDYHDTNIKSITSSTAIRKALKDKNDIKESVPSDVYNILMDSKLHFIDDYFELLKYKIITDDNLNRYHTVSEGLDSLLKKVINECDSYDELIDKIKSKRYTYNKLKRMLLHILVGFTKEDAKRCDEVNYIRILGFNDNGRDYLNKVKKDVEVPIISKFERNNFGLDLELKSTIIYSIVHHENNLIKNEYVNHLNKEDK